MESLNSLKELKAKFNKPSIYLSVLPNQEKQTILNINIQEDKSNGKLVKIETDKHHFTVKYNVDLLFTLSEKELKTLTGFFKVSNYLINWEGSDKEVLQRLNYIKPIIKITELKPDKIYTVTNIKLVVTKFGESMLIETDDFKFFKNFKQSFSAPEIDLFIGEQFTMINGMFKWLD